MTRTAKMAIGLGALGLAGALAGGMSCGGVSASDVVNARNEATTAACNYYMMCGDIGPDAAASGNGFESASACQTMVLSFWTGQWTDAQCLGHIDETALSKCIDAINANSTADCNGLAVLLTLTKCGAATVCTANLPADAGAGN
jgi:hypothetical protein